MNDNDNRKTVPVYEAFKKVAEFINRNKYWSSLAAFLWAILCLLLYTSSQGIPFPAALIESPNLILSILFVAYFIPLCIFCLFILPAILTTLAPVVGSFELFEQIYIADKKIRLDFF